MKKISGVLIVAMIAFTMMAGAAYAGSIFLSSSLSYPAEAAKSGNMVVNLNTGSLTNAPSAVVTNCGDQPVTITYQTTSDLPSSARVVFHLTNATWQDSHYFLVDTVTGATMAGSDVVSGSDITFIVGNQVIHFNETMYLSTTENGLNPPTSPTIRLSSAMQTPGEDVFLAVTDCRDAVGTIVGCLANSVMLIGSYQQYTWSVNPNTKTIDVNPPSLRKLFVNDDNTARAGLGLINVGDGDNCNHTWRISLNFVPGTATLDYILTDNGGGQLNKLDELYIHDNPISGNGPDMDFFFNINGAGTLATLSVKAETDWALHDSHRDVFDMIVSGSDVLLPDSFNIAATLNFADKTSYSDVTLNSTRIMTWDINGWVGTVPYMFASKVSQEDTFIKIFNNSVIDGLVYVDVTPDSGGTVTGVQLATVPAGEVGIFWASDIITAAGLTNPLAFGAVFTVTAPQNSVTAMATQKRLGTSDRVVPVYTGSEGYKNW